MTGRHEFINVATGEKATGLLVIKAARFPRGMEFSAVFHDGLAFLSQCRLTATESAVFYALLAHLDFDNWVRISPTTMAEGIGIKTSNFCRAVTGLVRRGIVARLADPYDLRRNIIRVSPQVVWRGKASAWAQALEDKSNLAFKPIPPRLPVKPTKTKTNSDLAA